MYTIIGDNFEKMVHTKIQERNAKMTEQAQSMIEVSAEVDSAFQQSTFVTSRWLFNFLQLLLLYLSNLPFYRFSWSLPPHAESRGQETEVQS